MKPVPKSYSSFWFKGFWIAPLLLLILTIGVFSKSNSNEGQKSKERKLRISFAYDPKTLDPRKGSEPVASTVHFALYEGLTRMNERSTHEPGVAENIDISEDKRTYTFHLRSTYWTNGDPVTAEDFAYAWRSVLDPDFPAPNAHLLYPILNAEKVKKGDLPVDSLGIEVLDEKTLRVTLERPTPYFLDVTSFCVLYPVPSKVATQNPRWAEKTDQSLVTNGPFVLESWVPTDHFVFKKSPIYWEKELVKLDEIQALTIANNTTTLALFEAGDLDFMGGFCGEIQTEWIPELVKQGRLHFTPSGATKIVTFNVATFPFCNSNIRKAFSFAIDRHSIIENITQFEELAALGFVSPLLKNGVSNEYFKDADITKAHDYLVLGLNELGLNSPADLGEIHYAYSDAATDKKIAQALQQQWNKQLGVQVRLEEYPMNHLSDKLNRRDYQMGQVTYIAQYNDLMNILDRFKIKTNLKNYPGWENNEYVQLLESSAFASTPSERFQILEKAEQIMISEMPIAGIYHWGTISMQSEKVHDLFISPVGSLHFNYTNIDD